MNYSVKISLGVVQKVRILKQKVLSMLYKHFFHLYFGITISSDEFTGQVLKQKR